jgi:hypothetical protein
MNKRPLKDQLLESIEEWSPYLKAVAQKLNRGEKIGRTEINLAGRIHAKHIDLYIKLLEIEGNNDERIDSHEIGRYMIEDTEEGEGDGEQEE